MLHCPPPSSGAVTLPSTTGTGHFDINTCVQPRLTPQMDIAHQQLKNGQIDELCVILHIFQLKIIDVLSHCWWRLTRSFVSNVILDSCLLHHWTEVADDLDTTEKLHLIVSKMWESFMIAFTVYLRYLCSYTMFYQTIPRQTRKEGRRPCIWF